MNISQPTTLTTAAVVAVIFLSAIGCNGAAQRAVEQAEAQVKQIAADLDARTTETGVYVRVKEGEIKENDPWGTPVQVSYSQGGVAEMVSVRSAGPDRQFHTDDDLVAGGMAANLKGIGEGIKKNTEEPQPRRPRVSSKGPWKASKNRSRRRCHSRRRKTAMRMRKLKMATNKVCSFDHA